MRERIVPGFDVGILHRHILRELLDERIAKLQPVARFFLPEIHHLQMRHTIRPAVEMRPLLELRKLFPKHERSLLEHIIRIRPRQHERADEGIKLRLGAEK